MIDENTSTKTVVLRLGLLRVLGSSVILGFILIGEDFTFALIMQLCYVSNPDLILACWWYRLLCKILGVKFDNHSTKRYRQYRALDYAVITKISKIPCPIPEL